MNFADMVGANSPSIQMHAARPRSGMRGAPDLAPEDIGNENISCVSSQRCVHWIFLRRQSRPTPAAAVVNPAGPNAQLALGCPVPPSAKSLHALSAKVDSFGERMDLVLLRLATARLVQSKPENPGSIVWDYFARVRGMSYRGRNVVCTNSILLQCLMPLFLGMCVVSNERFT